MIAARHREAIIAFMEERGLSVNEWCTRAKVAPSTLYNFLNSKDDTKSLSSRTLSQLAEVENTTISKILGELSQKNILPISYVPVVTVEQIPRLMHTKDVADLGGSVEYVPIPERTGTLAAVKIPDTSINRQMGQGGFACFDLETTELVDGSLYVVALGDVITVRKFRADAPQRLEPDSTDQHQTIFLNQSFATIVGMIVYLATEPR